MRGGEEFTLWVEEAGFRLGFDHVSTLVFGNPTYTPYLYVLTVLIIDVPILSTISYIIRPGVTFHPILDDPLWFFIPIGLLIGVYGMKQIRSHYEYAIYNTGRGATPIEVTTPSRFRIGVYVIAIIIYLTAILDLIPAALATEGPVIGGIKWLLIIPIFYIPLIVEFFVVYIHGLVFLPAAIYLQDISLDFADPKNLGGMGPVGDLIISGTKFYYIGLIVWTVSQVIRRLTQIGGLEEGSDSITTAFFVIAWITGAAMFFIAVMVMHRHMEKQRNEKIKEVTQRIRETGSDDQMFPYADPNNQNELLEYTQEYICLNQVKKTQTYPASLAGLWELFGVAIFPILLEFVP